MFGTFGRVLAEATMDGMRDGGSLGGRKIPPRFLDRRFN